MAALGSLAVQQATSAAAVSFEAANAAHVSAGTLPTPGTTVRVPHVVPEATTTTAPPTTAPPTTAQPTTAQHLTATAPSAHATTAAHVSAQPSGYGCGPALAYLAADSAPGFRFECPGYSLGHQAMTCIDVSGVCAGEKLIVITVPCRAAYMNEASNSWSVQGLSNAPIDPYGYCH